MRMTEMTLKFMLIILSYSGQLNFQMIDTVESSLDRGLYPLKAFELKSKNSRTKMPFLEFVQTQLTLTRGP